MVWVLLCILLQVAFFASGAPAGSRAETAREQSVDFIRFNGAVYLSSAYMAEGGQAATYQPLVAADLGPVVGQVVTNETDPDDALAYPNEPCYWDDADGTAPRLAPGDDIYAVRGYATTFRLAAHHDGEYVLYQVWCNEEAEVGADLFDIHDRVQRISVTGDLSERSGWGVIDDEATLDELVELLLSGRIVPEEVASTAPVSFQLIVHLEDGTTFRASTAPGEFLWGLGVVEVPTAFDETLARAWGQVSDLQPGGHSPDSAIRVSSSSRRLQ
jgi:hypothetical protein